MPKKYPVTLLFIDDKENHEKAKPQIGIDQYIGVKCFETYMEFENFMENLQNSNLTILLFIHVFRLEELKGFDSANRIIIAREYPNLNIHYVTSNQPGATGDKINQQHNTFKYDEIPEFIQKGVLSPIKISDAKKYYSKGIVENDNYIFISHSSKDKEIVTSFFEKIIRLGLNVSKNNVFYSSHSSTGIATGEDIPDLLKAALNKMTLFIQYISEDYKASEVCLNEMGAAWIKLPKNRIIILKAPNLKFNDLGFLNLQRIGLCIERKNDLLSLTRDYNDFFDFDPVDLNNKVDEFISANSL
jgi:hypothetical protein